MSFDEVQFPTSISYGAVGGPGFRTNIVTLSNGFERRDALWSKQRGSYDIGPVINTNTILATVLNFFYARVGRLRGFRFKDWSDFELTDETIGQTDGVTATFQITKTYTSGPVSFVRDIKKPVSGSLSVTVNAVTITEGVGVSQYQVDTTTGIITLGSTLAAQSGTDINVTGEFDVPVRFDTDEMSMSIVDYSQYNWSVPLVEVRQ